MQYQGAMRMVGNFVYQFSYASFTYLFVKMSLLFFLSYRPCETLQISIDTSLLTSSTSLTIPDFELNIVKSAIVIFVYPTIGSKLYKVSLLL